MNLSRELKAESMKQKGKRNILVPLAFLTLLFFWTLFLLKGIKPEELPFGYSSLLYQYPVMNAILVPLMVSVVASRICDMEVKGDTMKILFTVEIPYPVFCRTDCTDSSVRKTFWLYPENPVETSPSVFYQRTFCGSCSSSPAGNVISVFPQPDPSPCGRTCRFFSGAVLHVFPGKYYAPCALELFCSLFHDGIKLGQNHQDFHLLRNSLPVFHIFAVSCILYCCLFSVQNHNSKKGGLNHADSMYPGRK